jgi:acetate kinase
VTAPDREPRRSRVLVLNAGSSTLKASVLEGRRDRPLGSTTVPLDGGDAGGAAAALEAVFGAIGLPDPHRLVGVGHRLVHGGDTLIEPARLDADVRGTLRDLVPLAPLHLPPALAVIDAVADRWPDVPQVGAFDTAFHAGRPDVDRRYPVPASWSDGLGIRRFGFHGLSVDWSTERAAAMLGRPVSRMRIVVAHLGAGSSVTAVDRGRSVHTSMGYTPLEGLMMATRSGSIDPGAILAAASAPGRSLDDVEADLRDRSGLLAIGGSADLRLVLDRAGAGDAEARLAVEMYVDRAAAAIGAAMTRLPSVDALVFTAGIGEHAAGVRRAIVRRLGSLGVAPITARASRGDAVLSTPGAVPAILRIEAREDLVIARAVERVVRHRE